MPAWLLTTLLFMNPAEPVKLIDSAVHAGPQLVAKYQCNRCHVIENVAPPPMDKQCVGCHIEIEENRYDAPKRVLRRWQKNIKHLIDVPSLVSVGERFRRAWLSSYLRTPHRLRPSLGETMPRLSFSKEQADQIAAHFIPQEALVLDLGSADLENGRHLLDTRGCGSCHSFGGVTPLRSSAPSVRFSGKQRAKGLRLAPDLRHTRERFQAGSLVRWIQDPASMKKDTLMPKEGLTEKEAKDIAAYILKTPLTEPPAVSIPNALPPLKRRVRYSEVEKKILHKTCWHCHSEPDYARGDGGPGNTGGFGFNARGINLADYAGVASGHIAKTGKRRSLFSKTNFRNMPLLIASLWARHFEMAGKEIPGIRGMPLGLPPLPPKEIQLIESWIAQGRPQ